MSKTRTSHPPEENGEIAEAWAPITMQMKSSNGSIAIVEASAGTKENSAGVTTPILGEGNGTLGERHIAVHRYL